MKPDLDGLNERLKCLDDLAVRSEAELARKEGRDPVNVPVGVAVCYVDNCSKVCPSLKATFGNDLLVKLDEFHWQKRWDDILFDRNLPQRARDRPFVK